MLNFQPLLHAVLMTWWFSEK